MSEIILGIDVSKKTLDAALIFDNRILNKQFQNSSEGFKLLSAWLASLQITRVHACLEATGIYGEAAQAGVTPRKRQSGTSLKQTSLSKLGNARLRKALYFPAIVARQHNEIVKEFAKRLKKNGKTSMQVVCAAMRKLLHIAFGVLKHKRPFDASLAFSA